MKIVQLSLLAFGIGLSSGVFANPIKHEIGVAGYVGEIDEDDSITVDNLSISGATHYSISYDFHASDTLSFGVSYTNGESSDFALGLATILNDNRLEYDAISLNATAQYPL